MNKSDANQTEARRQSILAEYQILQSETLKRIELQYQIFNLTLVVAGTTLTIGTGQPDLRAILLVYPILCLFFSGAFIFQTMLIVRIGDYIREEIAVKESDIVQLGWSKHIQKKYKSIVPLEILSAYGLFLGSEIMSLLLYYSFKPEMTGTIQMLFGFSIGAMVLTLLVLLYPLLSEWRQNKSHSGEDTSA